MTLGSEFWAGIIGAVVGASVGGFISFLIQRNNIKEARKERIDSEKKVEETLARILAVKTLRIFSNNSFLSSHIEECYLNVPANSHDNPFSFILPLTSMPDKIKFSAEEVSLIFSLKNDNLTNMMLSLAECHNSLSDSFALYGKKRDKFFHQMPAEMQGNVGTTYMDEEERKKREPQMVVMNNLINQIREMAERYTKTSEKALNLLNKLLDEQKGMKLKIELKEETIS